MRIAKLSYDIDMNWRIAAIGLGAFFLACAFCVAGTLAVSGDIDSNSEDDAIRVIESKTDDEGDRVTLAIPVEAGAAIDLETSKDVRIDHWEGDQVLVIVERTRTPGHIRTDPLAQPVDIEIVRSGKGIRIRASNETALEGMDVSWRVVLPKGLNSSPSSIKTTYDLNKLTSVVLGALQKEAIRWVIR